MFRKALVVCIAVLSLAFTGAAFAAGKGKGPESMVLQGGKTGNVEFPHQLHQTKLKSCGPCHDLFPREAGSIAELVGAGTLKKKQVMNTCISCHKENDAKGKETGPTSCKECHNK